MLGLDMLDMLPLRKFLTYFHPRGKVTSSTREFYLRGVRVVLVFKKQLDNNTYIDKGDYFEVTVNNSDLIYKVDSEDVEWMQGYTWHTYKGQGPDYPYLIAKKKLGYGSENREVIRLHVEIMADSIKEFREENSEYKKRIVIDHINGECTDNRKSNLRVRTQSENNMNKKIQSNNTSGFVGVTWHSKQNMWNAKITVREEVVELGSYYYLRNALRVRIEAEKKYFGEHAFYLRDDDYRKEVEEILSLPHKPEPVFCSREPSKSTSVVGVRYDASRVKMKYIASLQGYPTKGFETLEEAIEHREYLWRLEYGDRPMMHARDKKKKEI